MFDSRRPPRRQQNSKVETAGSRFGGIDVLGTDSTVWKDFAIVLAVLVVNVDTNPLWLAWILPTLIITPVIVWWNFRVARGGVIQSP